MVVPTVWLVIFTGLGIATFVNVKPVGGPQVTANTMPRVNCDHGLNISHHINVLHTDRLTVCSVIRGWTRAHGLQCGIQ
jgi:hypothetical protein